MEVDAMIAEISEQILAIAEQEFLPFMIEGVIMGFAMGSLFSLAAYGIVKAISLLNINNYNS